VNDYAFYVHNLALSTQRTATGRRHLSSTHAVRQAVPADAAEIHELLTPFAVQGALLARSEEEIAAAIPNYVVAVDGHGRIRACASIVEYSPSLAEVGSVAVAADAQGEGLGTLVVRAAEEMARRRGVLDLFAMSSATRFFESLGYQRTMVTEFPEKLARYAALSRRGVTVHPRACFRKAASDR
jgi:amino-acid N-acetyltransferase